MMNLAQTQALQGVDSPLMRAVSARAPLWEHLSSEDCNNLMAAEPGTACYYSDERYRAFRTHMWRSQNPPPTEPGTSPYNHGVHARHLQVSVGRTESSELSELEAEGGSDGDEPDGLTADRRNDMFMPLRGTLATRFRSHSGLFLPASVLERKLARESPRSFSAETRPSRYAQTRKTSRSTPRYTVYSSYEKRVVPDRWYTKADQVEHRADEYESMGLSEEAYRNPIERQGYQRDAAIHRLRRRIVLFEDDEEWD